MHVPLHDRRGSSAPDMSYCDVSSRVAFLLSKGLTLVEAQHAMHAVGIPPDIAAAAAAAACPPMAQPTSAAAAISKSPSIWRRMLVVGTGLVGAWSAWNLYGDSVVKWGSGIVQWLEGGGEAAAQTQDEQQQQQQQQQFSLDQLGASVVSPVASSAPAPLSSSRMVLRGNVWIDEVAAQQQEASPHALEGSLAEQNERKLQAEALKVTLQLPLPAPGYQPLLPCVQRITLPRAVPR
jgi:hypothetical protein